MTEVKIVTPTGMFGSTAGEDIITTAMRIIGVGFGEEGDWCAKYGTNVETDIFAMRRFYWGDCTCGADDASSEAHEEPHKKDCALVLPNFLYKPTGFALEWYKYIGRGMEVKTDAPLPSDFMDRIFATHPKGMTLQQAIAETERQEEQTAMSFAKMFSDLGIKTS